MAGGGRRLATLLGFVPGDDGLRAPAATREDDLKQLTHFRDRGGRSFFWLFDPFRGS